MMRIRAVSLASLRAKLRTVSFPPRLQLIQSTSSLAGTCPKGLSSDTEYKGTGIPPSTTERTSRRTLVLCFDGTGDQFDNDNSNVVKFFSLLSKGDGEQQLVYYQSGIGTGKTPQIATRFPFTIRKTFTMIFGNSLRHHVMDGYEYLMEHYKKGDRVCLFGFSRGAYTARALAGMVEKVGLLPVGNRQQVWFAYNMYAKDDDLGWNESALFKKSFSTEVDIEFVGVWDTVASVGIETTHLPFTRSNTRIKTFRHAISMDERRVKYNIVRFQGNSTAYPKNIESETKPFNQGENNSQESPGGSEGGNETLPQLGVVLDLESTLQGRYKGKTEKMDVLEVWFAGCHADVGGGSVSNETHYSLARIPLRWMIRQCFRANSGIRFQAGRLREIGLDPQTLCSDKESRPPPLSVESVRFPDHEAATLRRNKVGRNSKFSTKRIDEAGHICADCPDGSVHGASHDRTVEAFVQNMPSSSTDADIAEKVRRQERVPPVDEEHEELHDALSPAFDRMKLNPCWWILEYIPFFFFRKDKPYINKGRPRVVHQHEPIKVHRSVQMRMRAKPEVLALNENYKPRVKFNLENTIWVD